MLYRTKFSVCSDMLKNINTLWAGGISSDRCPVKDLQYISKMLRCREDVVHPVTTNFSITIRCNPETERHLTFFLRLAHRTRAIY